MVKRARSPCFMPPTPSSHPTDEFAWDERQLLQTSDHLAKTNAEAEGFLARIRSATLSEQKQRSVAPPKLLSIRQRSSALHGNILASLRDGTYQNINISMKKREVENQGEHTRSFLDDLFCYAHDARSICTLTSVTSQPPDRTCWYRKFVSFDCSVPHSVCR